MVRCTNSRSWAGAQLALIWSAPVSAYPAQVAAHLIAKSPALAQLHEQSGSHAATQHVTQQVGGGTVRDERWSGAGKPMTRFAC